MSDELVWSTVKPNQHFRARNHADNASYFVYVDITWGTVNLLTVFDSDHPAYEMLPAIELYRSPGLYFEAAFAAAQKHHNAACRSRRWAAYMRDNEPPQEK